MGVTANGCNFRLESLRAKRRGRKLRLAYAVKGKTVHRQRPFMALCGTWRANIIRLPTPAILEGYGRHSRSGSGL